MTLARGVTDRYVGPLKILIYRDLRQRKGCSGVCLRTPITGGKTPVKTHLEERGPLSE